MLKMRKPEKNEMESSISHPLIPFKTQSKELRTYPVGIFSGNP